MVEMFKQRAIFLLVISGLIIPLLFMTNEIISLGSLVVFFIIAQAIILYLFYKEKELGLEQWCAFWAAILGLAFMLVLVVLNRSLFTEFIGLIIFLIYFIAVIILLFKDKLHFKLPKTRKQPSKPKDDDIAAFRKRDELKELAGFFEPGAKSGIRVVDLPEPRIEKIVYDVMDEEEPEDEPEDEPEQTSDEKAEEEEEEWKELNAQLPKSMIFDYETEPEIAELPKVRELKETPRLDLEKVKKDIDKIDAGVKTISEKIKLISEKAILEGAEKRIRELQQKNQPKPKKSEIKVFASKTGTKFHYKKNCVGLGRVKNANMITYPNSGEARKKGLKACGMCK